MADEGVRYMWLLVFFDLPVKTKAERKHANRFRRFLKGDGYDMLQLSVYARVCRGREMVDKHLRRLNHALPPEGCVRVLQVTDKQYGRMKILLGEPSVQEEQGPRQLMLF